MRGWLKWSLKVCDAVRTAWPSIWTAGSTSAPSSAVASSGMPPSSELGRYGATPWCTADWCIPSRYMSLTSACGRFTGIWEKFGPPSSAK